MANLNGFDASQVEPAVSFDPIPAGKYTAIITASEMKTTSKGDGSFLKVEFTVQGGEFNARKIWDNLNIQNPSEQAQNIARGNLSAICRSVGVLQPTDSVQLHNIPLLISVKTTKRKDNGEMTNEIGGYAAATQVQPAATTPPAVATMTPAATAPANPQTTQLNPFA